MKKELLVLGGGIKGAATAAVGSLLGDFQVTLLERERIGSGTTATNHGRLHLGTAGWEKEKSLPALIQRRLMASELVRELPDVLVSKRDAIYCFEDATDADNFQDVLGDNGIPYRLSNECALSHEWIEPAMYRAIVQVPEYSFNPAKLAGRFAQTCVDAGGRVSLGCRVKRIERKADRLVAILDSGETLTADLVVNTMSRWCASISLPPDAPHPNIKWFKWRLLCLHSGALPGYDRLDQVVVVVDRERRMPSAIPHDKWITLDFNATPVQEVASVEDNDASDWREFDPSDDIDERTFAAVSRVFSPLVRLGPGERKGRLFSLAGIQARRIDSAAGSQNRLESSDQFTGYFVAFGGQASTGLLDAIEICRCLHARYSMTPVNRLEVVRRLASVLSPIPLADSLPMRWEQHSLSEQMGEVIGPDYRSLSQPCEHASM